MASQVFPGSRWWKNPCCLCHTMVPCTPLAVLSILCPMLPCWWYRGEALAQQPRCSAQRTGHVKRVGLVAKPHAHGLSGLLHRLLPWLAQRNVEVFLDKDTAAAVGETTAYDKSALPDLVDGMVVL